MKRAYAIMYKISGEVQRVITSIIPTIIEAGLVMLGLIIITPIAIIASLLEADWRE